MSSDDLLARATRAMRDAPSPDERAAATLARIESSLAARRARQRTRVRWFVMPLAASFLVFAAWASASGSFSRWFPFRSHDDAERIATVPSASPQPTPAAHSAPSVAPTAVPSEEPEPAPAESKPPSPPPPTPSVTRPAAAPSVDVDALYRDAHDAHFVQRDPAAALARWDRYLAAAGPSGRFTLEARYNRAISLVRLGRRTEAIAALRPFADGEYGGYRRDEAAQLLHTLE